MACLFAFLFVLSVPLASAGRGRLRTLNELLIESQSVDEGDLPSFLTSRATSPIDNVSNRRPYNPFQTLGPQMQVAPKKKQLRTKRLRRTLGRDFDEHWMSVKEPLVKVTYEKSHQAYLELLTELNAINASVALTKNDVDGEGRGNNSRIKPGGAATLTPQVAKVVEKWLLQRASCRVTFVWDDLGALFWPRWVKRGVCGSGRRDLDRKYGPNFAPRAASSSEDEGNRVEDESDEGDDDMASSCSWPPGMHCVPYDSHTLRVLRWHCYPRHQGRGGRDRNNRDHHHRNSNSNRAGNQDRKSQRKTRIKCTWIKVPYPVTSECYCSC